MELFTTKDDDDERQHGEEAWKYTEELPIFDAREVLKNYLPPEKFHFFAKTKWNFARVKTTKLKVWVKTKFNQNWFVFHHTESVKKSEEKKRK